MSAKEIQGQLLSKLKPIFMKNGCVLLAGDIDGPYESPKGEEELHDICFEVKIQETFPIFKHEPNPKHKNPMPSIMLGKNKRSIPGVLMSYYHEPYLDDGLYVAEVLLEPMNKTKMRLCFVVAKKKG